jgi:hypothetical protein
MAHHLHNIVSTRAGISVAALAGNMMIMAVAPDSSRSRKRQANCGYSSLCAHAGGQVMAHHLHNIVSTRAGVGVVASVGSKVI